MHAARSVCKRMEAHDLQAISSRVGFAGQHTRFGFSLSRRETSRGMASRSSYCMSSCLRRGAALRSTSAVGQSHAESRWLIAFCRLRLACAPPAHCLSLLPTTKNDPVRETVVPAACKLYMQALSWRMLCAPRVCSPGVLESNRLTNIRPLVVILPASLCPTMSSTPTHDHPSRRVPCMLGSIDRKAGLSWTEPDLTLDEIRDQVAGKTRFLAAYGTLP
jgi:hypothetical protein